MVWSARTFNSIDGRHRSFLLPYGVTYRELGLVDRSRCPLTTQSAQLPAWFRLQLSLLTQLSQPERFITRVAQIALSIKTCFVSKQTTVPGDIQYKYAEHWTLAKEVTPSFLCCLLRMIFILKSFCFTGPKWGCWICQDNFRWIPNPVKNPKFSNSDSILEPGLLLLFYSVFTHFKWRVIIQI